MTLPTATRISNIIPRRPFLIPSIVQIIMAITVPVVNPVAESSSTKTNARVPPRSLSPVHTYTLPCPN